MTDDMAFDEVSSPPMANGEVVFEAPWQSRVFGITRLMCEQGLYNWDEFRECLIKRIEASDHSNYQYFEHFLGALTDLLDQKKILSVQEIDAFATELMTRPHGHDH